MKKTGWQWKLYYWSFLVVIVVSYGRLLGLGKITERSDFIVYGTDLILYAIALIGAYHYIYQKAVRYKWFWRLFLVLFIVVKGIHSTWVILSDPQNPITYVSAIVILGILYPMMKALFLYGFKQNKL